MDLKQVFNKELNRLYDDKSSNKIWIEAPASLDDFVTTSLHLSLPPLSDRQRKDVLAIIGPDPTRVFSGGSPYKIGVLVWGKAGGKDYITSIVIAYFMHILQCMRHPQAFFQFPTGESIDVLNVAYNRIQAIDVFFDKFKQRLLHWKWLRDRFTIMQNGKYINARGKPEIRIGEGIAEFPHNIRTIACHSDQEGWEGYNPLAFVLDEFAAFKESGVRANADKIYSAIATSASSRFGNRYKGFILSYPRHKDDPIMRKYQEALVDPTMYASKAATWEVKPERFFSGKKVMFNDMEIPVEFEGDFRDNPESAMSKLACIPPESESPLFALKERVELAIDYNRLPMFSTESYIDQIASEIKVKILNNNVGLSLLEYVICVDLGQKKDSAALAIAHRANDTLVHDLTVHWDPIPKKRIIVSFMDVADFIVKVCSIVKVGCVYFDQWQSGSIIEVLNKVGIRSAEYKLSDEDYLEFKTAVYTGRTSLLNHGRLLKEMFEIQLIDGIEVDHPSTGSKDCLDCVVGAYKTLFNSKRHMNRVNEAAGGYFISSNLGDFGGTFLKEEANNVAVAR